MEARGADGEELCGVQDTEIINPSRRVDTGGGVSGGYCEWVSDVKGDIMNAHGSGVDESGSCESELSSVSTRTAAALEDEVLHEQVNKGTILDEDLGLIDNGSSVKPSEGIVEAVNFHDINNRNIFKLNYGKEAVFHDEFQLLDGVSETETVSSTSANDSETSRSFVKTPELSCFNILLQKVGSDFKSYFEMSPKHHHDKNVTENLGSEATNLGVSELFIDTSDRNNNSSEDGKNIVRFETNDPTQNYASVGRLSPELTETEPMTCAQFLMFVNPHDRPVEFAYESDEESETPNSNGSNPTGLRRLDTIASIESDEDLYIENLLREDQDCRKLVNASSDTNDTISISTTENDHNKNIQFVKSDSEPRERRKSTGIFIKKYEKEGRSRSPSPIPRRYRKHSVPLQKHPDLLGYQEFANAHSSSNPDVTVNNSKSADYKRNYFTFNSTTSEYPMGYSFSGEVKEKFAEGDKHFRNNSAFETDKLTTPRGRVKNKSISGGSTGDDEVPSGHRSRPIEIDVKGKKIVYDLISCQGVVSPEAPDDNFGFDRAAKKEVETENVSSNEDMFTNKALLAAFAYKKLRALRNSFRRERKRTVSSGSGSESTCSEPARRRLESQSQSSLVLKLTERDDSNREVIEGFIEPIKLPPKKQRTLSSGDETSVLESKPKVVKSQRSRSHGHLGQTVPVTIKIPSALTEPWRGAWDNTVLRIVEPNDTLASVAAHFDITPSELAILNRLPSRTVFPGQVIRVPDKRRRDPDSEDKENKQDNPDADKGEERDKGEEKSEVCDEEMDMLEKLRLTSPKPGHAERVRTPLSPTPDPSHQRFLKINVRHITDGQGVVSGVLLVTSNAVMFDPNVSDPLVIEHGPESYGVIAPMEYVVNVAIYHDIAHMRVGSHDQFRPDWPKPEVYHLKEPFPPTTDGEGEGSSGTLLTINQGDSLDSGDPHHSPSAREDSLLAKDETFPELRSSTEDEEEEDAGSLCSCSVPREGDAFPKAFDRDLVTPTNLSTTTEKQESEAEDPTPKNESVALIRSLEERRKSSLDHHWAVPSKVRSLEEQSASVSDTQVMDNNRRNSEGLLVKLSCHDSGIDIRDPPPPVVPQMPRKSVYSDADVLLSDDFVPPVPIQPLRPAAVSFSLDQSQEGRSSSESHDSINLRDKDDQEKETKKNKMLKRLSYPLSWMEGLSGDKEEKDSLPSSAESHPPSSHSASSSVFSKVFSRRSSVGTFIRQQHQHPAKDKSAAPKLDYRSMVSVEDMPELFVSFDKLIPRPAQSCDDPPLYLRLRMGKPKDKKIPKSTPIMSYGKKKMRPEYWFSVPRERVDDLYRFLMVWVPQLYGDLDEATVADRGYELVDSDTELWETEDSAPRQDGRRGSDDDDIADLTRESWEVLKAPYCKLYTILKTQATMGSSETGEEVLSMSEELRRALYASSSLDLELCVPDLNGVTEILSEDHRKQLCRHLPARAEGYVWTLVFSTSQHGFSLNSMYRKMTRVESPILMVIQDTDNNVFGALTSCALKMSDHFYGTGESLLFRFTPDIQVYNWTGDNMYFIKGNNESLSIGAGDGKFGLWLDGDLYQGRTEPCNTYGNDPLTPSVDFVVKTLECWAFI